MMIYEHDRTNQIVKRLVSAGNSVRLVTILNSVSILAGLLSITTAVVFGVEYWWFGAILGLLIGLGVGTYLGAFLMLVIEWMAQLLVAQGEVINRSGK